MAGTLAPSSRTEAGRSRPPDGTAIAYRYIETWRQGNCGSDYSVGWVSNAEGGNPRLVVPEATNGVRGAFPSGWSPDGSRIAYSEDLVPPEGCDSPDPIWGVSVLDVRTGDPTLLAYGFAIDWVDDRTLLIRAAPNGRE